MIFATVGSALPFDRLIRTMDAWAAGHPDIEVVAQIGEGTYLPEKMKFHRMVTPAQFGQLTREAEVIVAHAGMGSVITALELSKPIVLLARRADVREHTTDHQLHTAKWLRTKNGIFVAESELEIPVQIAAAQSFVKSTEPLSSKAPSDFTSRLRMALSR